MLCLSFTVFDETTNPPQDTTESCLANRCMPWSLCYFTSSSFSRRGPKKVSWGQCSSDLDRKAGPLSHRQWWSKSGARRPRVQSSAGLQWPGTCLHCVGLVVPWISETRLATNVWKRRVSLAMYCNTVFESLQKMASLMLTVNSCLTTQYNLTAKTAAWSSKRGILYLTVLGGPHDSSP